MTPPQPRVLLPCEPFPPLPILPETPLLGPAAAVVAVVAYEDGPPGENEDAGSGVCGKGMLWAPKERAS